jgi:hypothetical protein
MGYRVFYLYDRDEKVLFLFFGPSAYYKAFDKISRPDKK